LALSDKPSVATRRSVPRRAAGASSNKHWSDGQKIEAIKMYLTLGNLAMVGRVMKIPEITLRQWKATEWWANLIEELRIQDDLQLSNRLKKIIEKSHEVIEERLDNGDFVYDQKTGQLRRRPVSMKDAHKVAMDLSGQKEHLIDQHMEQKSVSVDKIEKRLAELADSFAKIANSTKPDTPVVVTDVIFGDDQDATEES